MEISLAVISGLKTVFAPIAGITNPLTGETCDDGAGRLHYC